MLQTVVTVAAICGVVRSSGLHHAAPIANALAPAPVVTASSSQYFERTFNRLVAPQVFVDPPPKQFIPVHPIQPVPIQPVTRFHPVPAFQSAQPVQPVQPTQPVQPFVPDLSVQPIQPQQPEPNVAIAIATANAAAPVATILLPPYPFGFPPAFGLIPQEQPADDKTKEETTTQNPTTRTDVKSTRDPEATTQVPDESNNNVGQALPSNLDVNQVKFRQHTTPSALPSIQNVNLNQYGAPTPVPSNQDANFRNYLAPAPNQLQPQQLPLALPQPHHHHHHHHHYQNHRPLKLKTLVEVQKVPLAYIAPPPLPHYEHNHQAIKVVKHIHSFVPSRTKLIIRPVVKTRSIPANAGYKVPSAGYKDPAPQLLRSTAPRRQDTRPFITKEIEPTTFRPIPKQNTKPPRL